MTESKSTVYSDAIWTLLFMKGRIKRFVEELEPKFQSEIEVQIFSFHTNKCILELDRYKCVDVQPSAQQVTCRFSVSGWLEIISFAVR